MFREPSVPDEQRREAHMFISIKKILPLVAERLGFRGEVEIYEIYSIWPKILADFFVYRKLSASDEQMREAQMFMSREPKVSDEQMREAQMFKKESNQSIKPLYIKNKTLVVSCPDSVWAQELQVRRDEIIKKINKHFQDEKIEKIRFVY